MLSICISKECAGDFVGTAASRLLFNYRVLIDHDEKIGLKAYCTEATLR